jgi:hypothetical protein
MTQKMTSQSGSSSADSKAGMPHLDEAAGHLKEGILDGARTLGAEVQHLAGDVAGDAKKSVESKAAAGKDFAAEQLGTVADALRKTSKELRAAESGATDYVDMAARSVEKVSSYLQTRTLGQLIGDVEGYARREPAMFLGGAFLAGVLGGRFLKSAKPAAPPVQASRGASGQQPGMRALPQHTQHTQHTQSTRNTSTQWNQKAGSESSEAGSKQGQSSSSGSQSQSSAGRNPATNASSSTASTSAGGARSFGSPSTDGTDGKERANKGTGVS